MKIVFFHASLKAGGAERMIVLLSNYLASQGEDVTILTMDNSLSFYKLNKNVTHKPMGIAADSRNILEAVKHNLNALLILRKAVKEIRPQIAVGFATNTVLHLWLVKFGCYYKIIGSERSNPYAFVESFWNNNKKRIFSLCDGFIFQTKGAQTYYPNKLVRKSIILSNGIISNENIINDTPWNERKNICAVGRMDKHKCFDDLLKSFAIVNKKYPKILLNLYGDGPLKINLEKLSKKLGIQNVVTFHGKCDNMYSIYAKHKFFLMSSEEEGMPNVLMEALASGCACISTDCNFGPSELIENGRNGFLVPVHDVDLMAERIEMIIDDDFIAQSLSMESIKIRETHNIEIIGEKFHSFLKKV